jgi:hypothetical protein
MSFQPRSRFTPRPPRIDTVVLAVGQTVFVNCAPGDSAVVLTDEGGIPISSALSDGSEVQVLAWRPRGTYGTRYRVLVRGNRADGWLGARQLRPTATAAAPVPAPL